MPENIASHLRRKIITYTICVVLLSNFLIAFIVVSPLRKELREHQVIWLTTLLNARTDSVKQLLTQYSELTTQITTRSMIRNKLQQYQDGLASLDEVHAYTAPKLQDALQTMDGAIGMVRLDSAGTTIVSLGLPLDQPLPPHTPPAGNKRAWNSAPIMLDGQPAIIMASSILAPDGRTLGTDAIAFSLSDILKEVEARQGLGKTGKVALCFASPADGKLRNADLDNAIPNGPCATLGATRSTADMEQKKPFLLQEPSGSEAVYLYSKLPFDDLLVTVAMDQEELYSPAKRSIMLVTGLIVLTTLISLAGAYRLLHPLANRFLLREGELATIIKDKTLQLEQELKNKEVLSRELQKAKEHAEVANRSKSEFLANMSHEIRTPINGIMGMLQLMKTTSLDTEQGEFVGHALRSSRRLLRLLSDILDLSRIEADKMELVIEPFQVEEVMDTVVMIFQPIAEKKGLEIRKSVDPAIPNGLLGDSSRLQQVLNNLVGNAIKFTEKGHIHIRASLLPKRQPDEYQILFSVSDTGIGIGDDVLPNMFSPFIQADGSYNRNYQGVGLGLAISKRIILMMNGNMSVESEKNVGSTFYCSIPFRKSDVAVADAPQVEEAENGRRLDILLAEDDNVSAIVARKLLMKLGHRVQWAGNGQEALEKLQADNYDLVLMDVQMPVMDGAEATRRIRSGMAGQEKTAIPIIALTAYAMDGDRDTFLAAGMNGYLDKPLEMDTLLQAINQFGNA